MILPVGGGIAEPKEAWIMLFSWVAGSPRASKKGVVGVAVRVEAPSYSFWRKDGATVLAGCGSAETKTPSSLCVAIDKEDPAPMRRVVRVC
jgi:hypothetical protein